MSPQLRQFWLQRFDFLDGALPGRINPSDIDQVLDNKGNFLFIECKRPHQTIPRGQEILLDHLLDLSSDTHNVQVLQVVGQPPEALEGYRFWRNGPLQPATTEDVRRLVRNWWDWASAR